MSGNWFTNTSHYIVRCWARQRRTVIYYIVCQNYTLFQVDCESLTKTDSEEHFRAPLAVCHKLCIARSPLTMTDYIAQDNCFVACLVLTMHYSSLTRLRRAFSYAITVYCQCHWSQSAKSKKNSWLVLCKNFTLTKTKKNDSLVLHRVLKTVHCSS